MFEECKKLEGGYASTARDERQKWESEDSAVEGEHFILRGWFVPGALSDEDTMRKKPQSQGGGSGHSMNKR
jgi:hypothetical protein